MDEVSLWVDEQENIWSFFGVKIYVRAEKEGVRGPQVQLYKKEERGDHELNRDREAPDSADPEIFGVVAGSTSIQVRQV